MGPQVVVDPTGTPTRTMVRRLGGGLLSSSQPQAILTSFASS
ncbi:hypothetical protein [Corynebacterium belfantii]